MCIGIPMQVVSCDSQMALCQQGDRAEQVDIGLVGQQPRGTWLLVFLGAAREVMAEDVALKTLNALKAMEAIAGGDTDIDHLFADLVNREPALPEHLRAAAAASVKNKN